MGILSFLFGGGNIRIAAESIYNLYRDTGFNYLETFKIRFHSLFIQLSQKIDKYGLPYYYDVYQLFMLNNIRNLAKFALLDLNINAAPYKTTYYQTQQSFAREILSYLAPSIEKYGLNSQHFVGNNNNMTANFVRDYFGGKL